LARCTARHSSAPRSRTWHSSTLGRHPAAPASCLAPAPDSCDRSPENVLVERTAKRSGRILA
jgi:hypothetical protein